MNMTKATRMTRDAGQLQRIVEVRRRRSAASLAQAKAQVQRLQTEAGNVQAQMVALAQQRAALAHSVGAPINLHERLRLEYARMIADQTLEQARNRSLALDEAIQTALDALALAESGSMAAERRSEKTQALSEDVARSLSQALARKHARLHEGG